MRGAIERAFVPGPEPACARRVATPVADRYRGSLAVRRVTSFAALAALAFNRPFAALAFTNNPGFSNLSLVLCPAGGSRCHTRRSRSRGGAGRRPCSVEISFASSRRRRGCRPHVGLLQLRRILLPDDRLQAGAQQKGLKSHFKSFIVLWLAGQKSRVDRDFSPELDGTLGIGPMYSHR